MKRNLIPPFIMLLAGSISSLIMYFTNYNVRDMLIILLAVLVVFYLIGLLIKSMMDSFDKVNTAKRLQEGEVIEKEVQSEEEIETQEKTLL